MAMKTRGVLAYLFLAFGLARSTIFVARLLLGLSLENSLVQISIAFSPAIAAVIVRGWITKEGFGDAGLALHLRSGWTAGKSESGHRGSNGADLCSILDMNFG